MFPSICKPATHSRAAGFVFSMTPSPRTFRAQFSRPQASAIPAFSAVFVGLADNRDVGACKKRQKCRIGSIVLCGLLSCQVQ